MPSVLGLWFFVFFFPTACLDMVVAKYFLFVLGQRSRFSGEVPGGSCFPVEKHQDGRDREPSDLSPGRRFPPKGTGV